MCFFQTDEQRNQVRGLSLLLVRFQSDKKSQSRFNTPFGKKAEQAFVKETFSGCLHLVQFSILHSTIRGPVFQVYTRRLQIKESVEYTLSESVYPVCETVTEYLPLPCPALCVQSPFGLQPKHKLCCRKLLSFLLMKLSLEFLKRLSPFQILPSPGVLVMSSL